MSKKARGEFKVLFVAGFGPIVQDIPKSHKFYAERQGNNDSPGGRLDSAGQTGNFIRWLSIGALCT